MSQYFEDITVGDTYLSPGRTITESDVGTFAGLTGDYNELHTNAEHMKGHLYGRRIAHGLLGLSIQEGLSSRVMPSTHIIAFAGIKNWDFRGPIYFGDTIRVRVAVTDKRISRSRPDRGLVTYHREVLNQHDEIVQEGDTVTMVMSKNSDDAR